MATSQLQQLQREREEIAAASARWGSEDIGDEGDMFGGKPMR